MGYNLSSSSITVTAKLTPFGRQQLVSTNNSLITSFSLGDSDANYYATLPLTSGEVPASSGNIGPNSTVSNSTTQNTTLKSVLIVNNNGVLKKSVEPQSIVVSSEILSNGQVTISGTGLTQTLINRNDYTTDSLVNLFYSFGLPLNSTQDALYTATTFSNGGFSDTALSGIARTKILVLSIDNSTYGESLDGKEVKLDLTTSAGTYTIYSTFQNKGASLQSEDVRYRDTSNQSLAYGSNVAFLFSDDIMTPNGGSPTLSWGTGFAGVRPFSVDGKQLYNLQTNTTLGKSADTCVGMVYLDKGLVLITDPQIIADYDTNTASASTITFDSISTSVFQNITCIANRNEFYTSTNPTFGSGSIPRITEIGLYDSVGNLIAFAKTDRQITKSPNTPLYIGVNILI